MAKYRPAPESKDCNINNWILKFADDTKIFSKIIDDKDRDRLQQDLLKLTSWSVE